MFKSIDFGMNNADCSNEDGYECLACHRFASYADYVLVASCINPLGNSLIVHQLKKCTNCAKFVSRKGKMSTIELYKDITENV
jgi:hypothetical protein